MPKALTRDELQAQTRELVLGAAERVFLEKGYHATSVAKIAEEAGRTQGSIYGNFASKEALCQEILRAFYTRWLMDVGTAMFVADGVPAKLNGLEAKWRALSEQREWIGLTAEYVMAARHLPEQAHVVRETVTALSAGVADVFLAQLQDEGIAVDDTTVNGAVTALVATGMGLAINQSLGTIGVDQSTTAFMETITLWRDRLAGSA